MLTKKDNNPKSEIKNNKSSTAAMSHEHGEAHHDGCCQPNQKNSTKPSSANTQKQMPSKSRITIKYNAGFPNQLFIRGKGANLNWEKGQLLQNTKPDEWIWETEIAFQHCEFKILINDQVYENGENHLLNSGATLHYSPSFY